MNAMFSKVSSILTIRDDSQLTRKMASLLRIKDYPDAVRKSKSTTGNVLRI
jgi:hypothetical protein